MEESRMKSDLGEEKTTLKIGMYVTISNDPLTKTEKSHGVTPEMRKMIGKRYKIVDIWTSSIDGVCAQVNGFSWHSKDLIRDEEFLENKEELFHFNIEELSI